MGHGKWIPLIVLASGLGCTSLAGLDGDYVVGDTSTGGETASGTGGTTSGTGGSTSGTGGSTSGTGGTTSGTGGSTSGTGGVGGTTSGTGGVGGSGPEDCLDGQDNNGDNLVDCADPLCQVDYECVPDVTNQAWVGYFDKDTVTYPAPSLQLCPDSTSPQVSFSGPGGAAQCAPCTCGAMTGSCSYPTASLWINSSTCGNPTIYNFNPNDNNCHAFPVDCGATCSNDQRMRLSSQSMPSGASCPASGGGATVPPLWSDEHHLCPMPTSAGGCNPGSLCVAKQSCVQQKAAVACPNEWPQAAHAYGSAVDTRGCTNCLCIAASTCQGGKFTVYDDTNCNGGTNPNIDITGTNCVSLQNHMDEYGASYRAFAGTLAGSCTPNGGQPSGTVAPSEPVTICCR